jgi:hypothetical protein
MIGRRNACSTWVAVVIGLGGFACVARAANLPDPVRGATSAAGVMPQIQAYIEDKTKALSGDDAPAQSAARDDLINPVLPGAPGVPSTAFLAAYSGAITGPLTTLAGSKDPRVRLNAAVITARVAEHSPNTALQPLILKLLNDDSEATRLWALKAAKAILPAVVTTGGPTLKQIVDAVVKIGKETTSGPVVQSVYDALAIEDKTAGAKVLAVAVPALHDVLAARIARYQTETPDEPLSEGVATIYLTTAKVWAAQTEPQKLTTMQRTSDLIGVAAQRAAGATSEQKLELIEMIRRAGKAIQVLALATAANKPAYNSAGQPAASLILTATGEQCLAAAKQVYGALAEMQEYKGKLTPFPTISTAATAATTNAK